MKKNSDTPESRIVGQNRVRAVLFFVLAGVAGLAGIFLFIQYMDEYRPTKIQEEQVDTVSIVVAKMNLPIAARLEKKHLTTIQWPSDSVPIGSHGAIDELLGRTVLQAIVQGEPLLDGRLADERNGQGMAALLSMGMRAMAVKVDTVVGVAGFVQPGDFVDVITTMTPDDETKKDMENDAARISKIILQNIRVLAVGEHLATEGREPVKVKVVTLAVSPQDSEKLALGSQHGRIRLTMRSRIDQEEAMTDGATPLSLLVPSDDIEKEKDKEQLALSLAAKNKKERSADFYKKHRRKNKKNRDNKEKEPKVVESPVVEILRGNKIEERTLRAETTGGYNE